MNDPLAELERLGREPAWGQPFDPDAGPADAFAETLAHALSTGDRSMLDAVMGGRTAMFCMINAPTGDEPDGDDDRGDEDKPDPGDDEAPGGDGDVRRTG